MRNQVPERAIMPAICLMGWVLCFWIVAALWGALLSFPSMGLCDSERVLQGTSPIKRLDDGRVQIGLVEVDPVRRTLTLPALVNAREGLVEYGLVTREGKVHESIFSTESDPLHLHLGALLLNWVQTHGPIVTRKIQIQVEWETAGGRRREPIERLIVLAQDSPFGKTGQPLSVGAWEYAGRVVSGGTLAAQAEGSIVALIQDESALVWNPRPSRVDDQLHAPNAIDLPPVGSAVKIEFCEVSSPEGAKDSSEGRR